MPKYANKFSLGGLIWLPLLAVGLAGVIKDILNTYPKIKLKPISVVVILGGHSSF